MQHPQRVVIPCRDVVVTKYSATGEVLFNTCLRGSGDDIAGETDQFGYRIGRLVTIAVK